MSARPATAAADQAAAPFTELSARRLGPVRRYFLRHPVSMDVVVMVLFVLSAALGLVANARPFQAAAAVTTAVVVVLCTALLFWRRRRPVWVAAGAVGLLGAAVVLTGTTAGTEVAVAFALYAVAAALPTWTAWTTFAATLVGTAGFTWFEALTRAGVTRDANLMGDDRVASIVGNAVMGMLALAIGISVRNRRLHVADLVERANALARDRDQQARLARAAERSRIAREMHDVVAHSLSVMIALGDGAAVALARAPDRAREALDELSRTGRTALADMRRVLGVLDGAAETDVAPLEPQPGSHDLADLVERFRTAGLPVRASLGDPLPDDATLQLGVYRIVQEALTNVLRHAPGTGGVRVVVRTGTDGVAVEVVDEGGTLLAGPTEGAGRGLIGMRERAALYGGTVEAGPWHGGWRVSATLPWRRDTT